jgi:hypothetical protein
MICMFSDANTVESGEDFLLRGEDGCGWIGIIVCLGAARMHG